MESVGSWEARELPALVHPREDTGPSAAKTIASSPLVLPLLPACSDLFQPFHFSHPVPYSDPSSFLAWREVV